MLRDWQIGSEGHTGYGLWQIEQVSTSEFETVASHQLNVKTIRLELSQLADPAVLAKAGSINFTCKVRGVPPNCADKYRVTFSLELNNQVVASDSDSSEELMTCEASGIPTMVKRRIGLPDGWQAFSPESIVVVTLAGKDVEYWGGNFGTRFSSERLFLELRSDDEAAERSALRSLVKKLGEAKVELGDNFGCFF